MTTNSLLQLFVYLALLTAFAVPLGAFIADVFEGKRTLSTRMLGPIERGLLRLAGVRTDDEMHWKRYATALLLFNVLGTLLVYLLLRVQHWLPGNPAGIPNVPPGIAFNTAVSFATNTNWQTYAGESTLSYASQMLALTVQNFVSAATGISVLIVLIRGFSRRETEKLGNFWQDLVRTTLYVLLPLSLLLALLLVSQGVVQTLAPYATGRSLERGTHQLIALGPAASQIAIKQLGTNGGGFFNANSAHPLENPNAWSNVLQLLAILLIPAALCFTYGRMVKDRRQGIAIYAAMMLLFVPLLLACVWAEQRGNPALRALGVDQLASALQSGGNMEGKEVRFGITQSSLWAVATTAASNGSVNAMHDSFTPLGGLVPLFLMQLGEIVFGGVGSGLYGMLVYAVLAVFIAGLMVGRTPELLGKKIEAFEMKMAALVVLIPASAVLLATAIACIHPSGYRAVGNPGTHGFSEILYAFSSAANNNGSAFGGLTVSGNFYTTATGICMWIGRYWVLIPVLAMAGSLGRKKSQAITAGTLPTHTPLFVLLLVGTIVLIGALTFVPALALGPVVEHLQLHARVSP